MSRGRKASAAAADTAPLFAALGDGRRLALVIRLCAEGPLSITQLSDGAEVTRQAITKHLRTLADAGVVHGRRSGRECIWAVETKRLEKAKRYLDQMSTQWDSAIDRLRTFVEDDG